tara:strand:- start:61716 stop:63233 length:1518 start_codon:yes stop_codon:yes gene_type:complete
MARSLTNNAAIAVAIEASIGTLPATPLWVKLEPNTLGAYGSEITTTPRNPISNTRQQRKGSTTDLDSSVEWEGDLTKHHVLSFIEGFVFAQRANNTVMERIQAGADYDTLAAVATPEYSHDALSAALVAGTLIFARGFDTAGNNGLKEVDAASSVTLTKVTTALTAETPAVTTGARIDVCGFRLTDAVWTDSTKTLTTALVDETTLGLSVGQKIRVGSDLNSFTNGELVGRIVSIHATNGIVLDKVENLGLTSTLSGGGDETATDVDILYGPFIRNTSVDDADFVERSFQFELTYNNLQNPDGMGDEYEYAIGNLCNELTLNLPGQDKGTMSFGFIGTNSDDITTTRKGNVSNSVEAIQNSAFNTSSDFARLNLWTTAEADLGSCFKTLTLTLGNEVSPEKCLGTLGALFMNTGNFSVSLDAELLFTDSALAQSIKDNATVTFDVLMKNDDGAIALDIPSLTLGGGARSFPVNESIKISVTGTAFQDATLGTSIGITEFPYFPAF